jgi:hypothetical protein
MIPMSLDEIVKKIYQYARANKITHSSIIGIVDFTLPSNQKRFRIVEMNENTIRLDTWVAHGSNTGGLYARNFSNTVNSHKTSIGVYRTAELYIGKHGRSMRLDGLEKGFNDNVRRRAIVVHKSNYIGNGKTGRSWGCFAVPNNEINNIIALLPKGHLLIAYYPDPLWLKQSKFIHY